MALLRSAPISLVHSIRVYTDCDVPPINAKESTEPHSDRLLVERFLHSRSEDDFRLLYRSNTPRLMMFALRICGGDNHEAEDLVQETWSRACVALAKFRWKSAFSTWLIGIAVNCYREHRRIAPTVPLEIEKPIPAPPTGTRDLDDLVARLPERCREVVVLHLIHGYSHSEIAPMLQIAEATSRHHLFRARKILTSWLSPPTAETEK